MRNEGIIQKEGNGKIHSRVVQQHSAGVRFGSCIHRLPGLQVFLEENEQGNWIRV